ncbi:MAG: stage V sporulation protein AC [Clostridia bacterium]|nr:stage V sporulation protein AC [Clostridia bacterium]MBR2397940.1 stage V sporulation protein AC [Clostridia bacterium]MBR2495702.1 stage V sporulation protein AC [Clostridia bacterium]MBR2874742.1 stage V sporulation protein AC [Clostridia bacterium]
MLKISHNNYVDYVSTKCPKTNEKRTLIIAFLVGGLICCIGQAFKLLYEQIFWTFTEEQIAASVSGTLIFIGCFLSGIGVYDSIGAVAGAGSMVPITGFANSVVSPALEFKSEGMIYGLAAKMFIIAGPIIVYGVLTSALVGVIYYFVYL